MPYALCAMRSTQQDNAAEPFLQAEEKINYLDKERWKTIPLVCQMDDEEGVPPMPENSHR